MTRDTSDNMARLPRPRLVACVLFGLIIASIVHNVMLSTMRLPVNTVPHWSHLIWIGVMYSQPTLLAVWAAFGAEPLLVRLPRATALVCLVSLTLTVGVRLNQSGRLGLDDLATMAFPLCQFIVLFFTLGLIRRRCDWHLSVTPSRVADRYQYSLLNLLVWTSFAAVLMAVVGWLFLNSTLAPGRDPFVSWNVIGMALIIGTTVGVFSTAIVFNVAIVLRDRPELKTVCWAFAFVVAQLLVIAAIVIVTGNPVRESMLQHGLVLLSFHIASLVVLGVIRVLGFRLWRRSDEECAPVGV